MMKKNILILTILIAFISIKCAKEECGTITFQYKIFDSITLDYKANELKDSIIYIDQNNNEYLFIQTSDSGVSDGNNFFKNGCKEVFYMGEKKLVRLEGANNSAIAFSYLITFVKDEEDIVLEKLVDLLTISIFDETSGTSQILSSFQIITSDRNGKINQDAFNNSSFVLKNDVVLLGKTFDEVYESQDPNPIYYSKEIGVVAFTDNNNNFLVFDRYE